MTGNTTIASIVEGHGEGSALPILTRRIAGEVFGRYDVVTPNPHRVKRTQMVAGNKRGQVLENAIRVQEQRVVDIGGVLVLADADDDCPIHLAQILAYSSLSVRVEVAIAVREFEAWFLASLESLKTHRAVRDDSAFQGDPERPRGAKGLLASQMTEPYRETLHQAAFASMLDLNSAMTSRSFRHLVTCIGRLLGNS